MSPLELAAKRDYAEPAAVGLIVAPPPAPAEGHAPTAARPPYFCDALHDAERMLQYAAEVGIDVEDSIRNDVLQARAESGAAWTDKTGANLLTALTRLAARLRPVTAESLKACTQQQEHMVASLWKWAAGLALIILPCSVASFVTSAFSDAIRKDIVTANELAVKIGSQLQAPATAIAAPAAADAAPSASPLPPGSVVEVVTELQQFASIIRSVDARSRRLNAFVLHFERDPYADIRGNAQAIREKFELPLELPKHLVDAFDGRLQVYQDVRYFSQTLLDDVSTFYGALATCLLPVLYALLGTCAYLLRTFENQMATKTFVPSTANSARFLIAGIGGAVVGLFNNFSITQGASIPPLAIAFLVGYAVDVFFSFLEGLLQAFTKNKNLSNPLESAPSLSGRA